MRRFLSLFVLTCCSSVLFAQQNVIDEIVWVVGDEAILRSDVESQRLFMQNEGARLDGDPYSVIPEQMAIQKLYLHQAELDSLEANETQAIQEVEFWVNNVVNQIGSKEKVEEYFNKKISQIKEDRKEMIKEQQIVQQMQQQIIGEIKLTPSDVRKYYSKLPQDSLPFIPTTVKVQIITREPKIPFEETDAIKARLRDFTEQINSGEREFSSLARMYSEDTESAKRGGELGFTGKGSLLPEFANVAFNLSDAKRVSKIVETEYGFHIIQLIEKRGDRINCKHILLKPKAAEKEINEAIVKMDSLHADLVAAKFPFEEAATFISYDKNTRNNKGIMVNQNREGQYMNTSDFEMHELPQEIGKLVYEMKVGDISKPFVMINSNQKEIIAIVKLTNKVEGHKANMSDDFQALKSIVESKKRAEVLDKWIIEKQKDTYVRIAPDWQKCEFKYAGWVKE